MKLYAGAVKGAFLVPIAILNLILGVVVAGVGLFFGCCNLLNTILAGRLDSAIFFPSLNIGVILLTLLCSIVFYKEKIKKNDVLVLLLGSASILLLNIW